MGHGGRGSAEEAAIEGLGRVGLDVEGVDPCDVLLSAEIDQVGQLSDVGPLRDEVELYEGAQSAVLVR